MLEAFSTPRNRYRSLLLFLICVVLAFAAATVGISDNPPGIALAFLSVVALVLAFVHPWRSSKKFRRLIYAALSGMVLAVILHNLFEGLAGKVAGSGLVQRLLSGAGVAFFFIALICPIALLVGLVGAVIVSRRT
jgi:hypothetical protein